MVRLYGHAPYNVFLVHGGPGAIGALKGFAKELNALTEKGIVEAIQSKYSIAELINELFDQIKENSKEKVTLIGHSWGAFLVILFAAKYPELVKNVVLVGCPPLEDKYVSEIQIRRTDNLSDEYRAIFERLVRNQATDEDMQKIPLVFEKSDNYCLIDSIENKADRIDSHMHNTIWSEAARLRTEGGIVSAIKMIQGKIYLIQGALDPHPVNGVVIPLEESGILCSTYILDKCGHSPFMEKFAKDEFYDILIRNVL